MEMNDNETEADFELQKSHLKDENRRRDIHMDFTESKIIVVMTEHNMIRVSDTSTKCMSQLVYVFVTFYISLIL